MKLAAIDLGTNSLKMLIADCNSKGDIRVLFRDRAVVRLGEGTFSGKGPHKIPENVKKRTLKALKKYAEALKEFQVEAVRATGTSAIRDAKNGLSFLKEIYQSTGLEIEMISGEEESRLIVLGVSSGLHLNPKEPALFVDLGGGSCEVTLVHQRKIKKSVSLPLGAVRLTETFFSGKEPIEDKVENLRKHTQAILKKHWPRPQKVDLAVGSAGTIKTLGRIYRKWMGSPLNDPLEYRDIDYIVSKIQNMETPQIAQVPGVDDKRAEILPAGALVVREVLRYFKCSDIIVSMRGLREGLLLDLYSQKKRKKVSRSSKVSSVFVL